MFLVYGFFPNGWSHITRFDQIYMTSGYKARLSYCSKEYPSVSYWMVPGTVSIDD